MRKEKLIIIAIIFLGILLRLINLNQSLWLDEAAQISESARPFGKLFDQAIVPHPPLFRILAHYWLIFGKSEWFLRLPSVIFGIGSIYFTYLIGKILGFKFKLKNEETKWFSLIGAFLLSINQYHIYYSQEFRPYSLFCFLGLVSTYFFLREKWLLYLLTSIAFLYTTYFAPFLLFSHLVFAAFFNKKILKRTLLSLSLIALSFLPYIPAFWRQIQVLAQGMVNDVPGWSESVSVPLTKVLPLTAVKFLLGRITFDNKIVYGLITTSVFLIYLLSVAALFKKRKKIFLVISIFIFVPILSSFLVSFLVPVIAPQRLIFCLSFMLLLFSSGVLFLGRWEKIIVISLFIFLNLFSVFLYNTNPRYQREDWKGAVRFVENEGDKKSMALFIFPRPFGPWDYYSQEKIEGLGITKKLVVTSEDLANFKPKLERKERIFLFQYLSGLTDPSEKTRKFLKEEGFDNLETVDFPGVGFVYIYERQ